MLVSVKLARFLLGVHTTPKNRKSIMNDIVLEFEQILKNALKTLYDRDHILIQRGGMEQACVARLYYYMQKSIDKSPALKQYYLDCEYNKNGEMSKRYMDDDMGKHLIARPDIILHQRGTNDCNIVIVEFKGWWNSERRSDIKKLTAFTDMDGTYRYSVGVFVKLKKSSCLIELFANKQSIGLETMQFSV